MKTTAERLSGIFCIPKTEREWILLGYKGIPDFAINGERAFYAYEGDEGNYVRSILLMDKILDFPWLTLRVPVQEFTDLLEDNICGWRLVEDGFLDRGNGRWSLRIKDRSDLIVQRMAQGRMEVIYHVPFSGCKTYTDIITLRNLI